MCVKKCIDVEQVCQTLYIGVEQVCQTLYIGVEQVCGEARRQRGLAGKDRHSHGNWN